VRYTNFVIIIIIIMTSMSSPCQDISGLTQCCEVAAVVAVTVMVMMMMMMMMLAVTEVKIVKQMPAQAPGKKPTVAVITSRYYEKLAVDAMMEDKTTFVKYKTEGTNMYGQNCLMLILLHICFCLKKID